MDSTISLYKMLELTKRGKRCITMAENLFSGGTVMATKEYTEKQKKIISGEIPIESVDGHTIHWLYKKALANNDMELAGKANVRLCQLKEEKIEKNRTRVNQRIALQRRGEFQWKQPKSNEYTEHQKQIVRGEIPYHNVHTQELIHIHQKALNNGDYELSERVLDLIHSRRQESKAKKKKLLSSMEHFDEQSPLSRWQQGILSCEVCLDECAESELEHIIDVLEGQNGNANLAIARQLLLYKQNPCILYNAKSHEEAIDIIEQLLQLPIRRTKTWFAIE